ncbi:hypothetical protein Landi51_01066 [Colletotrichum acutatum]
MRIHTALYPCGRAPKEPMSDDFAQGLTYLSRSQNQRHAKPVAADGFTLRPSPFSLLLSPTLRTWRVALEPALHPNFAARQSASTTIFQTGLASRQPGQVASFKVTSLHSE